MAATVRPSWLCPRTRGEKLARIPRTCGIRNRIVYCSVGALAVDVLDGDAVVALFMLCVRVGCCC